MLSTLKALNDIQMKVDTVSPNYSVSDCDKYYLSVYIDYTTVSYALTHAELQEVVLVRSYQLGTHTNNFAAQLAISDFLNNQEDFKHPYNRVAVAINHHRFTLVPKEYCHYDYLARFYAFNHPLEDDIKIRMDKLEDLPFNMIYSINQFVLTAIKNTFSTFTIHHIGSFTTPLLIRLNAAYNFGKTAYINIAEKHLCISCLDGENLLLYNQYNYNTIEDLLYFVINASQQVGFDIEKDKFIFTGNFDELDDRFRIFQKHLNQAELGSRPPNKTYNDYLNILLNNQFFHLFCIK